MYLSLDPGGTTGYAVYDDVEKRFLKYDQLATLEHHCQLFELLSRVSPREVIIERFVYQRRELDKGVSLNQMALEYIGITKLWCRVNGRPLTIQTPAQAKNLWTDEKLKATGLYKAAMPHAMDAVRHMLYYVTVTKSDLHFVNMMRPAR